MEFRQSGHLHPALKDPAARDETNAEKLLGRWVNTNRETRGIKEIVVERAGGGLVVRVSGVGEEGLIDWPTAEARVLANLEEEAGQRAVALGCDFDFPFMRAETLVRVNKGVLVIVLFVTFRDASGRAPYVNREFFYRPD